MKSKSAKKKTAKTKCAACGVRAERMSGDKCVDCSILERRIAHSRSFYE